MPPVRLGAVEYLNARPLVYGLERSPLFSLRFDVPSRCADLLHEGATDIGIIPSIEYLRGPKSTPYAIVPDLAVASNGPVASVAIYTTRPIADVRSIALTTSSRTSVALVRVLCARVFGIQPTLENHRPDLATMLDRADAALIIGDEALVQDGGTIHVGVEGRAVQVEKIDLGETWTHATGLPFVYALWAGRPGCLTAEHVRALQEAGTEGARRPDEVSAAYFGEQRERYTLGSRYLRDNIKYSLGPQERAGLELFYQYAADLGVVDETRPLTFF
jgi:chorismate dehydratase